MSTLSSDRLHAVTFILNGVEVTADAEPRMLLCDFLRQKHDVTGVRVGCEHGVCGACTVRVDGRAQRSCLQLAVQADGRSVETVEGLAEQDGQLSVLQAAFRDHHALQCGFCTPGILMSLAEYLQINTQPSEAEVREVLSGHLCRCTGYSNIVQAALAAADRLRGALDDE